MTLFLSAALARPVRAWTTFPFQWIFSVIIAYPDSSAWFQTVWCIWCFLMSGSLNFISNWAPWFLATKWAVSIFPVWVRDLAICWLSCQGQALGVLKGSLWAPLSFDLQTLTRKPLDCLPSLPFAPFPPSSLPVDCSRAFQPAYQIVLIYSFFFFFFFKQFLILFKFFWCLLPAW